jgi:TRAP-type mannitol/chloroaromatic compound transport system substrate-binding protein
LKTKVIMLLVSAVMILSLIVAGCAPAAEPGPAPTTAPTTAPTATPTTPTPAPDVEIFEWTLQGGSPAGSENALALGGIFKDTLEMATGGRITLEVFNQDEVVPTPRELDGAQEGVITIGSFDPVGERGTIPTAGLFGGYPGGPGIEAMDMWFYAGGGADLMERAWTDAGYNVKLLPKYSWNTPGEVFAASTVKLEDSATAMDGRKMRVKGDGGEIFKKLGVSTVMLSGSEIYQALDRGVIDMAECCSANMNWELAFHEVCPYAYFSLTRAPIQGVQQAVNREAWDALPADLQKIVELQFDWWAKRRYQQVLLVDLQAFDKMLAYGVQVLDVPAKLDKALQEASKEFYAGERAADPFFNEVFTSQEDFRKVFDVMQTLDDPNAFIS